MAPSVHHSHSQSAHDAPISLGNNIFLYSARQRGDHTCRHSQQSGLGARVGLGPRTEAGPTEAVGSSLTSPSLVVLCTWLGGATTRRVNHYVTGYRRNYPHAEILLIRTVFLDISVRSFATIRARLEPALHAIRRILFHQTGSKDGSSTTSIIAAEEDKPTCSRKDILLHVFSHGGCNTALQLMAAMPPDERVRFHARLRLLVFDCCPGDTSFQRAYEAAHLSLPPQMPLRRLGAAGAYGAVCAVHALQASGLMHSVRDLRQELNGPEFAGRGARRLYLFSDGDRVVAPGGVISHARAAEQAGYPTEMARFSKGAHCALIVEDASRYWDIICGQWARQGSVRSSEDPVGAADSLPVSKL